MAVEKIKKGKRKFERKRKRYKLGRKETAAVNKGFVSRYISMNAHMGTQLSKLRDPDIFRLITSILVAAIR